MRLSVLGLIALLAACAPQAALAPPPPVALEANVAPTINENYKSPTLDVGMWAQRFTGESREVYAARLAVVAALGLKPGERVADVGAGTGLFVKLFAEAVGPTGAVYANDIAPQFLSFIAENAAKDGLSQVRTVLGDDRTTRLPDQGLDVIFHSDVYHHFEYPMTMNADLKRALKPGGRLFVLDFEKIPGVTSPAIMSHVRADKATVIAEIERAGFTLVADTPVPGLTENYLLHFRNPG